MLSALAVATQRSSSGRHRTLIAASQRDRMILVAHRAGATSKIERRTIPSTPYYSHCVMHLDF
jgi:hypothetical protein